ncbi:RNA polymerase sigma factor [Auraticoccus monumenti]|uniref:RNA polymerase sigma factor, sigma-70 family n=1 Tax=Auraticoccus monumenti TaxID=675864 RepID=A0A1G6VNN7_9ACTN|nr:sigma-70 family RNA polymerase sigma factor [Auraticoccus monumenti]SDD54485.1 RNA polymerase sigma factor, sigma-70 family [Auraticoccus monumenti]
MDQPFEVAVREHGTVVLRVCRTVLGPGADAEDAWSETYLSALRAWPGLDPGADVRAWLVTIAHRRALDVTRARSRRALPVADVPEREGSEGIGEPPDTELWEALARLADKQRRCVAYHHVAGLPHAEVAAIVGGSEAAARRASADGIAVLRRVLAHREQERRAR